MEYFELLKKYQELCIEIQALRHENNQLKQKLGIYDEGEDPQEICFIDKEQDSKHVTWHSSVDEKIALFSSFFKGREDVYAKRWYSAKTKKSGYQPACENEWEPTLCDKQKYKCSVCPNRNLSPFNREAIYKHLSGKDENGRDMVGLYPLLPDDTCYFLAVDFDGRNFTNESIAFKNACNEYNIPAYIERSRSGEGAHVWIFFAEAISAATARKLGSGLLTYAMNKQSTISFSSYDRLFPNQDTMPSGGFGNLIALPLQGGARQKGNSVFVNDEFVPFIDQWAYLSTMQKMTVVEVDKAIERLCPYDELGELVVSNEEKAKPWESKKKTTLKKTDFPLMLKVMRANMLYVEKKGLSSKAINRLRRLAAFKNPDFYRAQAMRLPIYNKPRIICAAEDTEEYIGLPRGCEDDLFALLASIGITYVIEDKTNVGIAVNVAFNGDLREEQKPAAESLLRHENGVLSATTAFGKTVIGAYLIAERKVNTLVLVHTAALLTQWKQALGKFLTIDAERPPIEKKRGRRKVWSAVGTIGSGKQNPSGIVDIAIMQSLSDGEDVKELVRNYGMVIMDECHHAPAINFEKIVKYANAKYVYGLSATPTRQDGKHPLLFMQCGAIRYLVDAKTQAEKRKFSHTLIPRFTSFRTVASKEKTVTQLYSELVKSELRNRKIIEDAIAAIENNRTPIILTERTEHVEILVNNAKRSQFALSKSKI